MTPPEEFVPTLDKRMILKGATFQCDKAVLLTIAVILLILWILGLLTSTTLGGAIHALLVIALVVIVLHFIQGRRI